MYLIESYCFLTNETYIERFSTKIEQEIGLKKMFIREDIQVSSQEFQKVLTKKFYADGYDSITLRKEDGNECK